MNSWLIKRCKVKKIFSTFNKLVNNKFQDANIYFLIAGTSAFWKSGNMDSCMNS
jgi:hypothetical protein